MQKVSVASSRPGEFGAAVGAGGLGRLAGLLALVTEQVAEGGELAAVAAVFPAARLGTALDNADVAALGRS